MAKYRKKPVGAACELCVWYKFTKDKMWDAPDYSGWCTRFPDWTNKAPYGYCGEFEKR